MVFDQALLFENDNEFLQYSNDYKVISVIRDPSLQIANILQSDVKFLRDYSWNVRFLFGCDDGDLYRILKVFADSTKRRLRYMKELFKILGKNNMLVIDYEDFLFNHEETVENIKLYLGLPELEYKSRLFKLPESIIRSKNLPALSREVQKVADDIRPYYKILRSFKRS